MNKNTEIEKDITWLLVFGNAHFLGFLVLLVSYLIIGNAVLALLASVFYLIFAIGALLHRFAKALMYSEEVIS